MSTLRTFALVALLGASACVDNAAQESTMPEPVTVQGPPGGGQDQNYGYQQPQQYGEDPGYYQDPSQAPQDPAEQAPAEDGSAGVAIEGEVAAQDPAAAMANVDDQQIDSALAGHGHWEEIDGYGRVWVPDATEVGADFTPYETAGSWVDTDAGWAFSSDWDWGWLPFHYGTWGYFDGYWGWCPGYSWGPAWVDWRYGNGYVGWRPTGPIIRDHRTHHEYAAHDAHWRFQAQGDFGRGRVHAHLYNNIGDGLRQTSGVSRPPLHGTQTVHASSVMQGRFGRAAGISRGGAGSFGGRPTGGRAVAQPQPYRGGYQQPYRGGYQQPYRGGYQQPARGAYQQQQPYRGGGYQQPNRGAYQQPYRGGAYQQQQPYRGGGAYQRPTYQQPPRGNYQQPSRPSYQAPSRPSYSPPSRGSSFSAPSHSSSSGGGGGGSSHSSGGGGGGGSSHSSSSSSSSGGHHR